MFGLGAALAGLAGLMPAPILTVQLGMGENILILAFVVIVIGGIGSIRGAFVARSSSAWSTRSAAPSCPICCALFLELRRRLDRGARAGLDADLPADGGGAGVPAAGPVPGGRPMTALVTSRNVSDRGAAGLLLALCRSMPR